MATSPAVVSFSHMKDGTKADMDLMGVEYNTLCSPDMLSERVLAILHQQKDITGGAQVTMYEHGLQTATRAYRDGADEETIVCALLHDIGEFLSPCSHGEVAAGILRPYITPKNWWILQHHEVFQGYYYFHMYGGDKNKRDMYADCEYYQATIDFCERWDAAAFDPEYTSLPMDVFKPMVKRIFSRDRFTFWPNDPKAVAVLG